jgi:hypothetical protein
VKLATEMAGYELHEMKSFGPFSKELFGAFIKRTLLRAGTQFGSEKALIWFV